MTTIKLYDGDLGSEVMLVRCDLTQAAAPVQADYDNGEGFVGTQYQCADARHNLAGLVVLGKRLAARACEVAEGEFDCEWDEV